VKKRACRYGSLVHGADVPLRRSFEFGHLHGYVAAIYVQAPMKVAYRSKERRRCQCQNLPVVVVVTRWIVVAGKRKLHLSRRCCRHASAIGRWLSRSRLSRQTSCPELGRHLSRTAPLHRWLAHLGPTRAVRQSPWTQAGSRAFPAPAAFYRLPLATPTFYMNITLTSNSLIKRMLQQYKQVSLLAG